MKNVVYRENKAIIVVYISKYLNSTMSCNL